jgi:hypothetical protein
VAVIDGGVDTGDEALRSVLWVNPREAPGNGIDDDHNGYIDDLYGCNFIGGARGDCLKGNQVIPGLRYRRSSFFRFPCFTDRQGYADDKSIIIINFVNPDGPFATEEDKAHIPRSTVLFERALVNYFMDSLKDAFYDFKTCMENNYEKNDCYLWMGTIYIRCGDKTRGCELYKKADPFGNNAEAVRLIKDNCN